jgi:hypothetical protein
MTRTPSTPAEIDLINRTFDSLATLLGNLSARWADEHEYENLADYQARIAKDLPASISIVSMTKRPFGFKFTMGTNAVYHMFYGSRQAGWKRIG